MDSFTVILISAFFFIMGAALVGFMWYFMRITKKSPGKSKNGNSVDPNLTELARLMRNLQTQDLVIRMDGKAFVAAHELSPTQYRRLSFASNVLVKWLNQSSPEPQPGNGLSTEPSVLAAEQDVVEPKPVEPFPMGAVASPAESRPGYTPPFEAGSVEQIKPVSTELPDVVGGFLNPSLRSEPEFRSIASQINDILQDQLVGTPLELRGITVNDGHDRGVMVTLDGKQYQGVMEVPDEDVRRAIRTAVLEWETRK